MARAGAESTKEQVLTALEFRLNTIDPIADPDYFFLPDYVKRVEMPELQYLDTIFPEEGNMVYFIADEEGLVEEEATEDEMTEEMEIWVSVYRRVPDGANLENPFSPDEYFVKSKERTRIWSDFLRAMSVPDSELGLGFVENVNVTDNRPLWADLPESLEKWVGILFRVTVTYKFSRAEPWTI